MIDGTDRKARAHIPAHVPSHLIRDVDFYQIAVGDDPQRDYAEKFHNGLDIVYIPWTAKDSQWAIGS